MNIDRIIDSIDPRLNGVVIPMTGRVQIDARILGIVLTEREAMQQRMDLARNQLMNLQPHIDKLPELYKPFIDLYVSRAMEALK